MITHLSLSDWIDHYALSHEISEETHAWYCRMMRNAERWDGKPLATGTISDEIINQMLVNLLAAGRSSDYARGLKNAVLAIWRDAADAGLCNRPRKIRSVRCRRPAPMVWTPEQVCQLVDAAAQMDGTFRGWPVLRADYWESLIRCAWDTGLRRRDLHQLRRVDLSGDFVWRQHKTGKAVRIQLRPSTIERIDAWGRCAEAILWPIYATDETWRRTFTRLLNRACLPHGPFKTIRKSAGTAAEKRCPGAGHLLLGNTRAVFERHYLDVTQVLPPRPPDLG